MRQVHYGLPEKILMDQGCNFENDLLKALCGTAQVKKIRTSGYHPKQMDSVSILMLP